MGAVFRDRLGSVLMLVFIAALWLQRDYTSPFGGIFPDRIMVIMAVFVILTLILSFTRHPAMSPDDGKNEDKAGGGRWLDVVVVTLILLLWVSLFRYLGFALTGVTGFASIALFISRRWTDWKAIAKALALGAAIVFVIYMVFDYLLLVPLPPGVIFE